MKSRFTTVDIIASVTELRNKLLGMRIQQVYDVDHKTYLLKMSRQDEKAVLLLESGIRIHTTEFEWPKNPAPSGFSMKLRKHLKNKRLESIQQLGIDRIIDLQFGINEAAYHVILELYDRGNIMLTDFNYVILNVLRPRTTGSEDVKFLVRETYPIEVVKQEINPLNAASLSEILSKAKPNDNMKKCLTRHVIYGPAILDHVLLEAGFPVNCQLGKDVSIDKDLEKLEKAMLHGESILKEAAEKSGEGYIILKVQRIAMPGDNAEKETETFEEFHPFLFQHHKSKEYQKFDSFNKAVDIFFSSLEGQKIDQKTLQKEKEALKKLDNIKKDHEKRVIDLQKNQYADISKAQLIEINLDLVDKAILIIRSAIANQIGWSDIGNLVSEAQEAGDLVAKAIKKLKLESNHFTMLLEDPYNKDQSNEENSSPQLVDIDLDLTAYANARKYYDFKKHAAKKEQKTLESSGKAYKNAEKKTKLALKEVALTSSIIKARKTFWFEKFLWFISSENYLVIAGRDSQQNELIVKRYLRPGDLYVHADLHGASSVVIKNPSSFPVPPKTQNEAGSMAICYSAAWDAKVVTSAWWVHHDQVSKTAPSGEYLTAGSFMIRGKKNYLPPSQLVMGFGFLFKLDEDSLERHANERQVNKEEDDSSSVYTDLEEDVEMVIQDSGSEDEPDDKVSFPNTKVVVDNWKSNSVCSDEHENVVYLGDDTPVLLQAAAPRVKQGSKHAKVPPKPAPPEPQVEVTASSSQQSPKRGQKSKMKKMKEKYKDQDDEERQLRMEILASAGVASGKEVGKGKKSKKQKDVDFKKAAKQSPSAGSIKLECDKQSQEPKMSTDSPEIISLVSELTKECDEGMKIKTEKEDTSDEEEPDESAAGNEDAKVLSSLTGCPVADDTLLFAVPVCAPYSATLNYKYKVKAMPGISRRGKAAKTALFTFLKDKQGTARERDLLKSVKDQDNSRNLPGKVKLSAPNLAKLKK